MNIMRDFRSEVDLKLRIARKWREAEGVEAIELEAPHGEDLPEWSPGAHIDLFVQDGSARQYSLCGDPANRKVWRIAILREEDGRGGSRWLCDKVKEGDVLRTRGPRNHFPFDRASSYLFIAGGIGITPLLPMIAAAKAAGADYRIAYGGRSRASMAFLDAIEAERERAAICPLSTGQLDLDRLLANPGTDRLVYCCGPGGLLDALQEKSRHWPSGSVRIERFSPKAQVDQSPDRAFEVELAKSGRVFAVPASRSLLEVLEEAGADVVSSCGEGTCGSCLTPVLSGELEHRDSVLTEEERARGDCLMVCVSRCRSSRLVLDIA